MPVGLHLPPQTPPNLRPAVGWVFPLLLAENFWGSLPLKMQSKIFLQNSSYKRPRTSSVKVLCLSKTPNYCWKHANEQRNWKRLPRCLPLCELVDVEALLRIILENALQLLDGSYGGIYLIEPDTGDLVLRSTRPYIAELIGATQSVNEGISGHVVRTGQIYIAPDIRKEPLLMMVPGERRCFTNPAYRYQHAAACPRTDCRCLAS